MNSNARIKWKDPVVLAFCERTECNDPVASVRAEAQRLVARSGIVCPPFSPFVLGSLKGIVRVKFEPVGFDACLIPVPGGFEVTISNSHSQPRQTFSMAHEIGHVLMMDPASPPKGARRESHIGSGNVFQEEEYLSDIGASELLFPSPYFETDAYDVGPSLPGVLDLAARYKASIAATVRRFAACAVWKCFFLIWSTKNTDSGVKLQLDQIVSDKSWQPTREGVSLRDETRILSAFESRAIVRGREWLNFDGIIEDRYYVESIRVGTPAKPRLLSMVITEPEAGRRRLRPTAPETQLRLRW